MGDRPSDDPPFCESQRRIALRHKNGATRTYFRESDKAKFAKDPFKAVG
jgi:hypothetical protein